MTIIMEIFVDSISYFLKALLFMHLWADLTAESGANI